MDQVRKPEKNSEMVKLGKALRRARGAAGMTLDAASAATGMHRATISAIENATREPRVLTVVSMLRAYGADANDVLDLEPRSTYRRIPARLVLDDGRVFAAYLDPETMDMLNGEEYATAWPEFAE